MKEWWLIIIPHLSVRGTAERRRAVSLAMYSRGWILRQRIITSCSQTGLALRPPPVCLSDYKMEKKNRPA